MGSLGTPDDHFQVQITSGVPLPIARRIAEMAETEGESRSEIIRRLLAKGLAEFDQVEEEPVPPFRERQVPGSGGNHAGSLY